MRLRPSSLLVSVTVAGAMFLGACGGSSSSSAGTTPTPNGNSSPTIISAGDAPMSSVLAALVTVSNVTFTSSSGSSVSLLAQPRQIELTHLGGIRAPLDLHALPFGTYSSVSLTVSAAQITYVNSSNQVVTAQATIPAASATTTLTLNPAFTVSDTGATDLRFDFDLQSSLDLTGSTVTFTPSLSAAVARVQDEDNDARHIHMQGTVTAVSQSANTITFTTDDTGLSVTVNVSSSTQFDDGLSMTSLATGTDIEVVGQLNSDGSISALTVEDASASVGSNGRVDNGIVTAVTRDSSNDLTGFTMVVRDSTKLSNIGQTLTVQVNSSTNFKDSMVAQNAGLTTFDQTQIFPGAAVWTAGTVVDAQTVLAVDVRPAQVNPYGLTSAAVQTGTSGGFVITLLLDNQTNFAQFAGLTSLAVDTNSNTDFDGQTLTSSNVGSMAVGTPIVARGFLSLSGTATTLFASNVEEEGSNHPNH